MHSGTGCRLSISVPARRTVRGRVCNTLCTSFYASDLLHVLKICQRGANDSGRGAGPPLSSTSPFPQAPAWGPASRAGGPSPTLPQASPPGQAPGMVRLAWGKSPAPPVTQDPLPGGVSLPEVDSGAKKGKKSGKGTLLMSTAVQRRY
jgi:hypothetical protein